MSQRGKEHQKLDPKVIQDKVQALTMAFLDELERCIDGKKDYAIVYGNSAVSAVNILFERYEVDIDEAKRLYMERWKPTVDMICQSEQENGD